MLSPTDCEFKITLSSEMHYGYQNLLLSVYKKGSGKILSINFVPNVGMVLFGLMRESRHLDAASLFQ